MQTARFHQQNCARGACRVRLDLTTLRADLEEVIAPGMKKPPLNVIAASVAALGVPGFVLAVAISVATAGGLAGAAAITTALAAISLGTGMVGGIAVLAVAGLLATGLTLYGTEIILRAVLKELKKRGHTKTRLLRQVDHYWISRGLKLKTKEYVTALWEK